MNIWLRGLGDILRSERALQRVTQEDVATRAGLSLRSYVRYENGERVPDVVQLRGIAQALGMRGSDLMSRIEGRVAVLSEGEDL